MARAAVPTGRVRLTDDEHAWIAGEDEDRSSDSMRMAVRAMVVVLLVLFKHAVEKEAAEMYERVVVLQVVGSFPGNRIHLRDKAAKSLAENAIRTALSEGYAERVWNEENGVWRLRLSDRGQRVSTAAWGEQLAEFLKQRALREREDREQRETLAALSPEVEADAESGDTPTGNATHEEGEA